jgi:hypothetical protein
MHNGLKRGLDTDLAPKNQPRLLIELRKATHLLIPKLEPAQLGSRQAIVKQQQNIGKVSQLGNKMLRLNGSYLGENYIPIGRGRVGCGRGIGSEPGFEKRSDPSEERRAVAEQNRKNKNKKKGGKRKASRKGLSGSWCCAALS